ncbi:LOW QUALITY PROTEIN: ABC-type dipeptide transport system, periplasmic component [Thermanaerovibrio velox DSM 12556]|uniref:ABC-type dipeptide transport system, periplasmic component n=1 Tax=Thermanaerovibrio velox DSM 12556 TaxID=926567 RepID=H0UMQ2_9BACT|nr:LOW QUALITY PROTEIN: ABC-type dipeptide transport system, periplasmic component [Thermanaerovibrio velox DSM 12556]
MLAAFCLFSLPALAAEKPVYGGTLVYRESADPPKIDPAFATDTTSDRALNLIFETLVINDPNGKKILPGLAESWSINKDATVFTFKLRKGVKFHSVSEGKPTLNKGREMRAEDVKYSFERLVRLRRPRAYFAEQIKGYKAFSDGKAKEWAGIKVIDPYTVQFTLDYPFAPFLSVLAYSAFSIVPKEDAEKWGKDFNFHPVGTGPFVFKEWKHDQKFVVERNKDYWGKDAQGNKLPYLDRVELRIVPDNSVAWMEFKKGNIDIFPAVPNEFYKDCVAQYGPKGLLMEKPGLGTFYIGMNMSKSPFKDNQKLRQALNWAIDRKAISDMILNGRNKPVKGVLPPGMPGYNPNLRGYGYDPAKAKKLLAEAGYPKGLEVEFQFNAGAGHKSICEAVQAQLSQIGVNVKLKELDWGAHLDTCDRGETQMFRMTWVVDYMDPDNFLFVNLHSSNAGSKGNYSFYKNPKVDKLLEAARSNPSWDQRMKLYREAEQLIVDDAPWIFMLATTISTVRQDGVKGYVLSAMGDYKTDLKTVWKSK